VCHIQGAVILNAYSCFLTGKPLQRTQRQGRHFAENGRQQADYGDLAIPL
jgi:hypothetical protein